MFSKCDDKQNLVSTNEQKIKNYIFQGGSVKGLAYLGALDILENNGVKLKNIKRIGGTSVGAIIAALLSVGYTSDELKAELLNMDFEELLDVEDRIKTALKILMEI